MSFRFFNIYLVEWNTFKDASISLWWIYLSLCLRRLSALGNAFSASPVPPAGTLNTYQAFSQSPCNETRRFTNYLSTVVWNCNLQRLRILLLTSGHFGLFYHKGKLFFGDHFHLSLLILNNKYVWSLVSLVMSFLYMTEQVVPFLRQESTVDTSVRFDPSVER